MAKLAMCVRITIELEFVIKENETTKINDRGTMRRANEREKRRGHNGVSAREMNVRTARRKSVGKGLPT